MKKQLLSMVALLFVGSAIAQEDVDLTPAKYKYADQPVGEYKIATFFTGANIAAPCDATIQEFYDNGLFIVAGGQFANPAQPYAQDLQAGTSIVDLGGEVGKVLCVNGVNSKYNTLNELNFAQCKGGLNWFNFNWFMDPQNTPTDGTEEAPNIRVRVVLNVFAYTLDESANIINSAYMVTNQGNVMPAGSNTAEGVAVTSGTFAETYEDGEPVEDEEGNYVYGPTKWMVYEWDTYCPSSKEGEGSGAPLRLKMEMNQGNLAGATVFIKEVSFTKLAENPEPILGTRKKSFVKYTVDPHKVDTAIGAVEMGNDEVEYFDISGMKVDAGNLGKGVFIMKCGNTVSKIVK